MKGIWRMDLTIKQPRSPLLESPFTCTEKKKKGVACSGLSTRLITCAKTARSCRSTDVNGATIATCLLSNYIHILLNSSYFTKLEDRRWSFRNEGSIQQNSRRAVPTQHRSSHRPALATPYPSG